MTEQPRTQTQDHDRRIGRLEGVVEQLDRRLDTLERGLSEVRNEIAALRNEIAAVNRRLDTHFRWLVGIQLTTLIAIGSLLFGILSKLP